VTIAARFFAHIKNIYAIETITLKMLLKQQV